MIKNKTKAFGNAIVCILSLFILGSCTSSKTNFEIEYAATWKKVLQSQAWKDALKSKNTPESYEAADYYVTTSDVAILDEGETMVNTTAMFTKKYSSLVSRAYFKIITEAEKADKNIRAEYERLNSETNAEERKKDKTFKNRLELVNKRYKAHSNMLEGLKSWKIFTDDITGDLEYFKAENENQIHSMYQNGENDNSMINILVYKLADLYHFEE